MRRFLCYMITAMMIASSMPTNLYAAAVEEEVIIEEQEIIEEKDEMPDLPEQRVEKKDGAESKADTIQQEDGPSEEEILDALDYGPEDPEYCNPEELVENTPPVAYIGSGVTADDVDRLEQGTADNPWQIGAASKDKVTAYMDGTTLVIDGTGSMKSYYKAGDTTVRTREWEQKTIKKVRVKSSVGATGGYCFANLEDLEEVVFEGTTTKINAGAFQGDTSLRSITFPQNLKIIYGSSFYGCTSLQKVKLPDTLTTIQISAFRESGIQEIALKKENAAAAKITTLGKWAFRQSALVDVTIPDGITNVDNDVFYGCENLKSVHLEEGVDTIYFEEFADCSKLEDLYIPYSMKLIDDGAFYNDSTLKFLHYDGDLKEWDAVKKGKNNDALKNMTIYYAVRVDSAEEFMEVMELNRSGDNLSLAEIRLETDIDLADYEIDDFTSSRKMGGEFKGMFDGKNHVIRNLSISLEKKNSKIGLFETLKDGATVRNIIFENVEVVNQASSGAGCGVVAGYVEGNVIVDNIQVKSGSVKGYDHVGGVIGLIQSGSIDIRDCVNQASIVANHAHGGGVIGGSNSDKSQKITNCSNKATVKAHGDGGGIIAYLGDTKSSNPHTVSGCVNEGKITAYSNGSGGFGGGIVGGMRNSSRKHLIENNTNKGVVTTIRGNGTDKQFHTGGIVGFMQGGGSFNNNKNEGAVKAEYGHAGGTIGSIYWGPCNFDNCQNSGKITASHCAAGVAGLCYDDEDDPAFEFINCFNSGGIYGGNGDSGGIVGDIRSDNWKHVLKNNTNTGHVESAYMTGGIIGWFAGGSQVVSGNENKGDIICTGSERSAGGIIGGVQDDPVTVKSCKNSGNISAVLRAGGIVGYAGNNDKDRQHKFIGNSNSGNVTAQNHDAAGIVATLGTDNREHAIENNSNSGEIKGKLSVGGIVGYLEGGCPNILSNKNTGKVTSEAGAAGGIVALVEDDPVQFVTCSNSGEIIGKEHTGGIAGRVADDELDPQDGFTGCINKANITSLTSDAGGIVGSVDTDAKAHVFKDNESHGDITAERMSGGIIGWTEGGCKEFVGHKVTGTIISKSQYAGGLIGAIENDEVNFKSMMSNSTDVKVEGGLGYGILCGHDGCNGGAPVNVITGSIFGNGNIWILISGIAAIAISVAIYFRKKKEER